MALELWIAHSCLRKAAFEELRIGTENIEYVDTDVFQGKEFYLSQFVKFVKSSMALIADQSCHQLFGCPLRKDSLKDSNEKIETSYFGEHVCICLQRSIWRKLHSVMQKGQQGSSKK